ncbi:MAG: M28 family peptidase [Acidobacteriia bacterium]|nr:M28 family peptidase [Terriglobia bacterium]
MSRRRLTGLGCAVVLSVAVVSGISAAGGGLGSIKSQDLKEWLSYIASDELEGREIYTSGIGLAAAYIEDHARAWGARPAGDTGRYLQTVRVLGVKATSHASVTVDVNGETRTFADGQGVSFPKNMGGKQHFTVDRVEFAGYGLDAPAAGHTDYRGKDVTKAAVVWLGPSGPKTIDQAVYRRLLTGRNRYATEQLGAAAAIGAAAPPGSGRGGRGAAAAGAAGAAGGAAGGGGRGALPAADFTTVQRLDALEPPNVTADDAFFTFLFSHAPVKYDELKQKAAAQEPLPSFRLDGVRLTFNVDAEYQVVRTQLTQNVVALVEGSDAQLKNTYIAFGAHYDHVGYAEGEVDRTDNGARRLGAKGRVTPGAEDDRIWNGADDDGSGTVALMALMKAFADGPHPKRSLLFVWHAGEERGLLGSRYFADYPTVPIDQIVAQLNIDMIGRNRDNKTSEANTVYLVGSDRISTELHNLNRSANGALPKPLTLNYEFNDPADLESLYTRSDHYSYAAKGIPIIFFTTGLHPDYHANTDEVSKIEFDKMTRIVQLVYETGLRVANLDHAPVRDNLGPRAGRLTQ